MSLSAEPKTAISATATLFNGCQISLCGLGWERPLYLNTGTIQTTGTPTPSVLFSSLCQILTLAFLALPFSEQRHLLLFFLLYLLFFFLTASLFISPPHLSLWLTCFHTPFSLLALGILTVENSVCFVWVWKMCANIACLYPLGKIMVAITHWCITKTDILLSKSWQTAYSSHCSVSALFVSYTQNFFFHSLSPLRLLLWSFIFFLFCFHQQLNLFKLVSYNKAQALTPERCCWGETKQKETALGSKSFTTDHFTKA